MKIHLIGIGGTGMGALAGLLKEAGHQVRGSDGPLYPPMSTLLSQLQIPLFEGYRPENLDWQPDVVVVGNICRKDHPEAVAAQQRGLRRLSFPALLSELFLEPRHVVVVAGTHGKTTTCSMMAHLLQHAGLEPGFLVGGIPGNFGRSYATGREPYFVVEGDEYDCAFFDKRPKFVHYRPSTVILTGVEFDHADIYPTMAHVEQAFTMLVERVPAKGRMLVCADSDTALRLCSGAGCAVESYSVRGNREATWQAAVEPAGPGLQALRITRGGQARGRVEVPMSGLHNMENALAVYGVGAGLGLPHEQLAAGLSSFAGVRRRQDVRGVRGGVTVVDDFAHHPTAIAETLAGLRGVHGPGKLVAVFEPRSATSRRSVFQQRFVEALSQADRVVLAGLHAPEGIPVDQRLDPAQLVAELNASGTEAVLLLEVEAMVAHLAGSCSAGDTVVVMSSGGFGGLIEKLLAALDRTRSSPVSSRRTPQ